MADYAAITLLKMQDRTNIHALSERFPLTHAEQQRLLTCGKAETLLLAAYRRVIITIQASRREHELLTSDPVEMELARRFEQEVPAGTGQCKHPLSSKNGQQQANERG